MKSPAGPGRAAEEPPFERSGDAHPGARKGGAATMRRYASIGNLRERFVANDASNLSQGLRT